MRLIAPRKAYVTVRPTQIQDEPVRLAVGVHVMVALSEARGAVFNEQDLAQVIVAGGAPAEDGFAKEAGEFLLVGKAFASGGAPVPAVTVRAKVGRLDKSLVVIGDRQWARGVATEPAPFVEMPLDWAHAFGGADSLANPLGKGLRAGDDGVHPLPNVELPERLVRAPSDRPLPAGFGPIEMMWAPRHGKLGTYGEAWLKDGFPGYARDLDRSYFNTAPPDQQLGRGAYWVGDEEILLENLHPTLPTITARLPGIRARVFVHQRTSDAPFALAEVPLQLETVLLAPNVERCILTFRGQLVVKDDDGDDVRRMLVALEGLEEARPLDHYRSAFSRRVDRKIKQDLKEDDLLPAWMAAIPTPPTISDLGELVKKDDLLRQNMKRNLVKRFEDARETLRERGLDPDVHLPVPKMDDEAPSTSEVHEVEVDTTTGAGDKSSEVVALKAALDRKVAAALEEVKQACEARGVSFEEAMAKAKEGDGGPPKFRADAVREQLRETAQLLTNAGVPDEENHALATLADTELERRLTTVEKLLLDGYRAFAHLFPPADVLDGAESDQLRAWIEEEHAAGKSLAGCDLTGAVLTGIDLAGADLRQAFLEKADLRGANLSGANLEGAVLTRADLEGAKTAGVRLAGANLAEARLANVDLSGADLRRAQSSSRPGLEGANLEAADLTAADLTEADLRRANLGRAKAEGARLRAARVEGASFARGHFSNAVFQDLDLSGLDFSGATLERAELSKCDGNRATFAGARMKNARVAGLERRSWFEGANFSGADLSHACLRDVELGGADFESANLDEADLSGANAEGAKFRRVSAKGSLWIRTNLKRADLGSANLMGATMKNANVRGAILRQANLFGANLFRVQIDGSTDVKEAELAQVMYVEDRS